MRLPIVPKRNLHRPVRSRRNRLPLEAATNLHTLNDQSVIACVDEQNLTVGARHLGFRLDYRRLAEQMETAARSVHLHICIAAEPNDQSRQRYFEQFGYITHVKTRRHIRRRWGEVITDCNIDNVLAFWTGFAAATVEQEAVIVIASGDYGLAGELAEAIGKLPRRKSLPVMSLSLPGSTAQDLDATRNPNIAANLEIGRDLLVPISRFL